MMLPRALESVMPRLLKCTMMFGLKSYVEERCGVAQVHGRLRQDDNRCAYPQLQRLQRWLRDDGEGDSTSYVKGLTYNL